MEAGFDTHCLAGGTHLNSRFGSTIDHLRDINGLIVTPIDHSLGDDSTIGVAEFAGGATAAFACALSHAKPDIVFVLGDRVEMLTATVAALLHRAPIAHLHGGERTLGAYDDRCRDAITMLSDYHFPALAEYADRIRSMGVADERICCVGALAIDALVDFQPLPLDVVDAAIGVDLAKPTTIVVFHPETLGELSANEQVQIVVDSLRSVGGQLLIFGGNADIGRDAVTQAFLDFAESRDDVRIIPSATSHVFHCCMARARCLVGNSSSGIIEAASHRLPVVNIGDRQKGRIRARNVIDVPFDARAILDAIQESGSSEFRDGLSDLVNPYGDGRAADRIIGALRRQTISQFTSGMLE